MNLANDLSVKKLVLIAVGIELATLGLVGLAHLGFAIPVVQQIVGFLFVALVPGVLILRILRVHRIGGIESLVYSLGLSLAFVMLSGLAANFALPLLGIAEPLSGLPITATIAVSTLILCAVAYRRDRDFVPSSTPALRSLFSAPLLVLLLLPALAALGALLAGYQQTNILMLAAIVFAAAIVGLIAFGKLVPRDLYPLAIVAIGLALLYSTTLASPFLTGYDIQPENAYIHLVLQSNLWDPNVPGNVNTALSLVMLGPILSGILGMEMLWVFKIVYPLVFCLVPLALFHAYSEQLGPRRAFFSAFFFMSMMVFFSVMPEANRQMLAELFLSLFVLLMIDRKLPVAQKTALAVIFTACIIVSHYALGFIFTVILLGCWLIAAIMRSRPGRTLWQSLTRRWGGLPRSLLDGRALPARVMAVVVVVYFGCLFAWLGNVAGGGALQNIRHIASTQFSLLSSDELPDWYEPDTAEPDGDTSTGASTAASRFVDPSTRERLVLTALGLDFAQVSPQGKAFRFFQILTELLLVIGFFAMILTPRRFRFRAEYVALSVSCVLILAVCVLVPFFSGWLEVERFYHITLLILAPMCVIGGEAVWRGLSRLGRAASSRLVCGETSPPPSQGEAPDGNNARYFRFLALAVLIPYFLFNTGFVFEVTGCERYNACDTPASVALSRHRLDVKAASFPENAAFQWLEENADRDTVIYADAYAKLSRRTVLYQQVKALPPDAGDIADPSYIYLKTWNLEKNEAVFFTRHGEHIGYEHISFDELRGLSGLLRARNLVYENGGAEVRGP